MKAPPALQLQSMPVLGREMLRAAARSLRPASGAAAVAAAEVRLANARPRAERVRAYRALCGFAPGAGLPLCYPQVMATPLVMHLLGRPEFPLPVLGLVHVSSELTCWRALPVSARYELRVMLAAGEATGRGHEFEVTSELRDAEGLAWRGRMRLLRRSRRPGVAGGAAREAGVSGWCVPLVAPAGIGRRYARVAGDYNPIHLGRWGARLFGFRAPIAHGMWTLARALALAEEHRARAVTQCEARFRRPLFLPANAKLYIGSGDPTPFAVHSSDESVIHVVGTLG